MTTLLRLADDHRRLLKVAEAARSCVEPDREGIAWGLLDRGTLDASCQRLEALAEALVALEAPVQETAGKNSALEKQRDYAQRAAYHEAAMRLALEACEAGEVATAIVALRWRLEAPVPEERA